MGSERGRMRMNAMRSGLVVIGAVAFGYISLQLGFKPFLEKAQRTIDSELQLQQQQEQQEEQEQQHHSFDSPDSASIVRD